MEYNAEMTAVQTPVPETTTHKMSKARRRFLVVIAAVLVVAILTPICNWLLIPLKYASAKLMIDWEGYTLAYHLLQDCGNYADAKKLLEKFKIDYAKQTNTNYSLTHKIVGYEVIERNRNGDLVYHAICDTDFEPTIYHTYKYDKYGNLTEITDHQADGQVKTFTIQYAYDSRGNMLERLSQNGAHTYFEYDAFGNLTEEIHYDDDGEILWHNAYEWDLFGNQLVSYTYKPDGGLHYKIETEYTWNGLPKKSTSYNQDGYSFHFEYTYTPTGRIKSETHYIDEGKIKSQSIYKYDIFGNMVEWAEENGTVHAYGYGLTGNILWIGSYNKNGGKLRKSTEYSYDFWGNQVYEVRMDSRGNTISSYRREYDWLGNMTKQIHYNETGEPYGWITYEYNWLGNLKTMTSYNKDGMITNRCEYEDPIIIYLPAMDN